MITYTDLHGIEMVNNEGLCDYGRLSASQAETPKQILLITIRINCS